MAIQRMTMIINGAERSFVCDSEETLANVVRRLGLTGTKVGCGTGQCGACEILVNGKLVRSCTKKMKTVTPFSKILTIEGIGTAEHLHPLQMAWIVYGGVQCGFCTPGFIMSSYALLQVNDNPTRQEVRDWFQKNRNACRCTGYKPLVDAVMAAAKVMRGEMSREELEFKMPENGRIYNSRYPRPAALSKVLGLTDYGADVAMKMPDVLQAAVVLPGAHHARILSIDTSEAEKAAGVVKVVTTKDVKGINRITMPINSPRAKGNGFERPIFNDKEIFRWGDIPALVLADTREHAREAAKLVKIELEVLPAYMTAVETFAEGALPVHEGYPPVIVDQPVFYGNDPREEFEKSAFTVEGSFSTSREPHMPLEPDSVQAYVDENEILTIHSKSLFLQFPIATISAGIGYPKEKIRIIENPTGGSFGYSFDPHTQAVVAVATLAAGRPVSLTLSYEEHMCITGKRLPAYGNAKLGCDKDGRLNAAAFEILMDKGAYSILAQLYASKGARFFGMPYRIPNVWGWSGIGMSNHAFGTAYRGAGSPQTQHMSEQLMDMLAEKAGIDPLEFRYKNVFAEGDEHYNGHKFSVYPMRQILDKMRPKYQDALERAKTASTDTVKRGVGICCGAFNVTSDANDYCSITVELNEENGITVYSTWQDQGQGADIGTLTNCHEAFRDLNIKPEQIRLVMNDTALPSMHGPSAGSRSHFMDGRAMVDGAKKLMDAMRKPDGTYRTYEEMVAEGIETKYQGVTMTHSITTPLNPNTGQGNPAPEYMWASYLAEVDVDVTTGKVKVVSMHCIADVGVVGNYLAVEGQAYGGMSHMIGFALSEDYSDVKKHSSMIGAGFPFIESVPDGDNFTVEFIQTPRPESPFGSCGCAEVFQSSDHVSILNAIYNAVGVRIFDIPATPDKILAGLELKKQGKEYTKDKYYFGQEFYERMDDIKANPVVIPEAK